MKIEIKCVICNKNFYTYLCYIKRGGGKYCSPECFVNNETYFWFQINIKEDKKSCWEWKENKNKKGYGRFYYKNKFQHSHRLAYFFTHPEQDIEENRKLLVCHKCDNPSCCNPSHLFLGTHQDNMNDRNNKNRQAKGILCHTSKLDEFDVKQILLLKNILHTKTIAEMYKIHVSTIYDIFNNKIWKHISRESFI